MNAFRRAVLAVTEFDVLMSLYHLAKAREAEAIEDTTLVMERLNRMTSQHEELSIEQAALLLGRVR